MAGCKGAKRILAINKDAEAPIMSGADYAVMPDRKREAITFETISAGVRFIRNINLSAMGDYGVVDETGQPEVSVPSDAVLVSGEHSVVFV